ncbi:MAG: hypothetical protein JXK07_03175 [Spirochaetes bacterium]|nr:hypothetical protein [Spirochaetota bacterium]
MKLRNKIPIIIFISLCFMFFLTQFIENVQGQTAEQQRQWAKKKYAKIPKINAISAYAMVQSGKMIIIDAGPTNRYKTQHCWGALNISETIVNKIKPKFPKNTYFGIY